ncbi:MAG TPA: ATP-binding protein [Flavisolibacter sp.]|nr:ATP-binding protein [Flavisolibacter sp.]
MHRVILSFLLSFILLLIVIALNRLTYKKAQEYTDLVEHSRDVIKLYDNLAIQLRSAEIYMPAYEDSSANELYAIYKTDLENIETNLRQLKYAVRDNKEQGLIIDSIRWLVRKQLPVFREKNLDKRPVQREERFNDLKKVHLFVKEGLVLEEKLLDKRRTDLTNSNSLNNTFTVLLAILAIVIITITFFNQFFISKKSRWLEGFLESILNTSQNGILHVKATRTGSSITDFKITYANRAIEELLGSEPHKLIGKTWTKIEGMKDSGLFGAFYKVVTERVPLQMEYLQVTPTAERWYAVSVAKMDDGVTVAFHEITAVKNYQQDLKKNIAALEQSNKELEEYAYAASHDLQEPLRKIRTFGGFLQDTQSDKLDEKGKLQLAKILQSAERMTLLIKDLLSFSSLQPKDEFTPTELTEILENVLQDLDQMIKQKAAIITHDQLPELEAIPVQMHQLFYNLVSNSLKFSRADLPLHLDISCRLLTSEDVQDVPGLQNGVHYYEIIFSDNGIGFNPDYATQIFGVFKRLNDKGIYTGSGIGLALCKKVVINHGGIITANGKEGLGAQFYIYLPQRNRRTTSVEGNSQQPMYGDAFDIF